MTGFGEAERGVDAGLLRVSIKTVNHRFLNTSVRTPPGFDGFEHRINGWVRDGLHRGHATITVRLEREAGEGEVQLPEVDLARATRYAELLRGLQVELELEGPIDVATVARLPDVLRVPEARQEVPEVKIEDLEAVVREALRNTVALREVEGERLREDMEGRLAVIEERLDEVEARAPERLAGERDRLREQIRELAERQEVDEDRLAREVAYLAERWDINEELVRFRAHVKLFRDTLDGDGAEAVGKRLGFVVQEMHREANTIGSKANDAAIAHASVAMREEVERLREQVENVE